MWVALAVAATLFAAILAMGYFAFEDFEGESPASARERELAEASEGSRRRPGLPATSDQVVFEVEHRIDAELRDIVHALHAHPERLGRIFHA